MLAAGIKQRSATLVLFSLLPLEICPAGGYQPTHPRAIGSLDANTDFDRRITRAVTRGPQRQGSLTLQTTIALNFARLPQGEASMIRTIRIARDSKYTNFYGGKPWSERGAATAFELLIRGCARLCGAPINRVLRRIYSAA
jgi:hypothetical protein